MKTHQFVQSHALLTNKKETNYIAIIMYIDDIGQAKQLPYNSRATYLSQICLQSIIIHGDIFIGKYYDNEHDFKRLDLSIKDLGGEQFNHNNTLISQCRLYASPEEKQREQYLINNYQKSQLKQCYNINCTNTKQLKKCAKCHLVQYCSRLCQIEHWKNGHHKLYCQGAKGIIILDRLKG